MKRILFISIFFLAFSASRGQQETINILKAKLIATTADTVKCRILDSLSMIYLHFTTRQDSSLYYIKEAIRYAFSIKEKRYLILAYARLGMYYDYTSQYKSALEISLHGVKLSQQYNIPYYLSEFYFNITFVYNYLDNITEELKSARLSTFYLKDSRDPFFNEQTYALATEGLAMLQNNKMDSALYYDNEAYRIALTSSDVTAIDMSVWTLGAYYFITKNYHKSDSILLYGARQCEKHKDIEWLGGFYGGLSRTLLVQNQINSSISAAERAMAVSKSINDKGYTAQSAQLLYKCYLELGIVDSAFHYLQIKDSINDGILGLDVSNEIKDFAFTRQMNDKEERANKILEDQKDKNNIAIAIFIAASFFLLIIIIILILNNKQRKKTNTLLQQQKEEIQDALTELKTTQVQLIQSEKMASLGELTAGIAHEIQNPLNFVNNFSEVNTEMIEELQGERSKVKGERNEEVENEIINNIKANEEKINHHGKRADAIVKGMLQHSRQTKGVKEPTDINALCDEYLRLSYHGLRAKDKSFNAELKTDFDESIGKINIIAQDIGRVLLNLFNNAFYACAEQSRSAVNKEKTRNPDLYKPTVSVTTKKCDDRIYISVSDNGNGIAEKNVDKIFQPFFTTKPTGEGTGLGLSLSYDIIKANGGEIKVETKEGEGSEFIIQLPLNTTA